MSVVVRRPTLLSVLQDKRWYSLAPTLLCRLLGVDKKTLHGRIELLRAEGVLVNEFLYNNRPYVGLESRRLDYERDARNGTNHVEQWIARGVYT